MGSKKKNKGSSQKPGQGAATTGDEGAPNLAEAEQETGASAEAQIASASESPGVREEGADAPAATAEVDGISLEVACEKLVDRVQVLESENAVLSTGLRTAQREVESLR
jgi:hypothetical protein